MQPGDILATLRAHGLLDEGGNWSLEPVAGGLNSRVYEIRQRETPCFTVRVARPGQRFDHEIEALMEGANCPGIPHPVLATDQLLIHEYLPGTPAPLEGVDDAQLKSLAVTLACLHAPRHNGYTAWPEHRLVGGKLTDLFRHRVSSLQAYDSYAEALAGGVDGRLPSLIETLEAFDSSDPIWDASDFARLHGDLSIGNMLWSEQGVGLIDWEYTRIGDPAEELAYIVTEQAVHASMAEALRGHYEAAGGSTDVWGRVPAYGLFTAVDSALWWADYITLHDPPQGASELGARIATAARWLASEKPV
jgi:thiamine kinase-like enzyme